MNKPCILSATAILLSACAQFNAAPPVSFLGDPAPVSAATETIVIGPDTRWVNVTGGDTVKFVVGDRAFAWTFNVGSGIDRLDLRRVAPPGTLDRSVDAYVAPDPRYIGGDGENRDAGI